MNQKIYLTMLILFLQIRETLPYSVIINNCDAIDDYSLDWKFVTGNQYDYGDISNGKNIPAGQRSATISPKVAPNPETGNYDAMYFATPQYADWYESTNLQTPKDGGNLYVKIINDNYTTSLDNCPIDFHSGGHSVGGKGLAVHNKSKLHKNDSALITAEEKSLDKN